ncbi:MAG: methyltransferase domain-containing protein [Rhodocyclales bacterium]|nr:methyltransferase domain-containing protein [Rhodocyclales bacterium]
MTIHMSQNPSLWVQRFTPLITAGGAVLDLACGEGRHSLLLAEHGYKVEAVDRDAAALAGIAAKAPGIVTRIADLEGGPWPYHGHVFDGIVVTNYLFRPLLPMLLNALGENGVLIYETFMVGNERFGKPANPAFLLRPGELLDVVRRRLAVVAFEQGEVDAPRPAVVQRLCATRGIESLLPA